MSATDLPQLVYSPHLSYWRSLDSDALHPEFLRYWAQEPAFVSQLHAMAHGTDMAPVPESARPETSRHLVAVDTGTAKHRVRSRALDDKIDSNRRLADLLEEAAATLFRARFVDFVGVEEFEESEIGRIPRGWRPGALDQITRNRSMCGRRSAERASDDRSCDASRIDVLNGDWRNPGPTSSLRTRALTSVRIAVGDILFAGSGSFCGRSVIATRAGDRSRGATDLSISVNGATDGLPWA